MRGIGTARCVNEDCPTALPPIRVIGIPMDLGQTQRGVDVGPSALRYAGLDARVASLGYRVEDAGNLQVPARVSVPREDLIDTIRDRCEITYQEAHRAIVDGRLPLFLGGDHSIAIGTIGGVTHQRSTGVIWIDAHGDFNTPETSPSQNVHGMPLAVLLGKGDSRLVNVGRPGAKLAPADVVVIGIRDLDRRERDLLRESGVGLFTMRDIDERGASAVVSEALSRLRHLPALHVSLDMDGIDPHDAPGVGTPVPGGLTYREAQLTMEMIADTGKLTSMDVVEVNPMFDVRNQTAILAVDLIASALGKSIL
jgi:arginase